MILSHSLFHPQHLKSVFSIPYLFVYFVFNTFSFFMQSSVNNKAGTVQEDALEAVATLVEVLGAEFIKYMEVSVSLVT